MKINDLFDMDLFRQMQSDGLITVRHHDELPLTIANYTDRAQFRQLWNDVTLSCRGLIFHQLTGEVIARPLDKFFNTGQTQAPWIDPDARVEVTDKLDGSLGILFFWEGQFHVATRGSFHSEQAKWATQWIRSSNFDFIPPADQTYMFEIIFRNNRIVLDYGDYQGLVLLCSRNIETGSITGPVESADKIGWTGRTAEIMPYRTINEVLSSEQRDNAEGVVIRSGNDMIKFKYDRYVYLHKLISGLSERSVWEGLAAGKTVAELVEGLPDEYHDFVRGTASRLMQDFANRQAQIRTKFHGHAHLASDRKSFAVHIKDDPDKACLFALLDGKSVDASIWKELRPTHDSVSDDAWVQPV